MNKPHQHRLHVCRPYSNIYIIVPIYNICHIKVFVQSVAVKKKRDRRRRELLCSPVDCALYFRSMIAISCRAHIGGRRQIVCDVHAKTMTERKTIERNTPCVKVQNIPKIKNTTVSSSYPLTTLFSHHTL